jgi:hypothetical protein
MLLWLSTSKAVLVFLMRGVAGRVTRLGEFSLIGLFLKTEIAEGFLAPFSKIKVTC